MHVEFAVIAEKIQDKMDAAWPWIGQAMSCYNQQLPK